MYFEPKRDPNYRHSEMGFDIDMDDDANVDVDGDADSDANADADVIVDGKKRWQLIDFSLEEKSAVTAWRVMEYAKSLKAFDGYLTLVDLKPKTGRYHQLRRHMVRVSEQRATAT